MLQQKRFNVQQYPTLQGGIGLLQEGGNATPPQPQAGTFQD
jgi:hypothetical protein